jgi:hypothetical protein
LLFDGATLRTRNVPCNPARAETEHGQNLFTTVRLSPPGGTFAAVRRFPFLTRPHRGHPAHIDLRTFGMNLAHLKNDGRPRSRERDIDE